jgi:hypothetical protein
MKEREERGKREGRKGEYREKVKIGEGDPKNG